MLVVKTLIIDGVDEWSYGDLDDEVAKRLNEIVSVGTELVSCTWVDTQKSGWTRRVVHLIVKIPNDQPYR